MHAIGGRSRHGQLLRLTSAGLSLLLGAVSIAAQSASKCPMLGTPRVDPSLVSVENRVRETSYQSGDPIRVSLTLRAGDEGAYVPDYFGPFLKTCSRGFSAAILNAIGRVVGELQGCAGSGAPPVIGWEKLDPGETRTWTTDLSTKGIAPGRYCLYAEYLSPLHPAGPGLPADTSLAAAGHISAVPVVIRIR